jgi:GntR family transcriptional regulator
MLLQLTDVSDEPLHQQISRQVRAKILAGELVEGDSLPSIRALARDSRVSVITVQRAYEDLDREELIHARRGKGFFVRSMSQGTRTRLAGQRFRDALEPLVEEGRAEGLDDPQMSHIFHQLVDGDGGMNR